MGEKAGNEGKVGRKGRLGSFLLALALALALFGGLLLAAPLPVRAGVQISLNTVGSGSGWSFNIDGKLTISAAGDYTLTGAQEESTEVEIIVTDTVNGKVKLARDSTEAALKTPTSQ